GRFTSRGGCASNSIPIVTATRAPAPKSTPATYSSWGSALIHRTGTWRRQRTTAEPKRRWRKKRNRSPLHPSPTKSRGRSTSRGKRQASWRMTKFLSDKSRDSSIHLCPQLHGEGRSNARSPLTHPPSRPHRLAAYTPAPTSQYIRHHSSTPHI